MSGFLPNTERQDSSNTSIRKRAIRHVKLLAQHMLQRYSGHFEALERYFECKNRSDYRAALT